MGDGREAGMAEQTPNIALLIDADNASPDGLDGVLTVLAELGPVVFLDVPFALIEERVSRNPERGIAMNPGEKLEDIFNERLALYTRYADLHCPAEGKMGKPSRLADMNLLTLPLLAELLHLPGMDRGLRILRSPCLSSGCRNTWQFLLPPRRTGPAGQSG